MELILREENLRRIFDINCFQPPHGGLVFFGLRGILPLEGEETSWDRGHAIRVADPDYFHPRCTIGQWRPDEGRLLLCAGSTVPHRKHVDRALRNGGRGANQMMPGYYTDYRRGRHKAGHATGHAAFRQTRGRPILRTRDDFDFDSDDRVDFSIPYDNLHAAWSMGIDHDDFASAGCQVVVGFPACAQRGNAPECGPWKTFLRNAYETDQDSFPYMLAPGKQVVQAVLKPRARIPVRLRFGSRGEAVGVLQKALKGGSAGTYEGRIDDDFGERTLRAVLAFQEKSFGKSGADGVVGPMTASALGIELPLL